MRFFFELIFFRGCIFLRLWLIFWLFLLWGFLKDLLELMLFKFFVFFLCFKGNGFSVIFGICLWFFFLFFDLEVEFLGDLLWVFLIFFEFNVVKWGFFLLEVCELECGEVGGCGVNFKFWLFIFLINSILLLWDDDEFDLFLVDWDCCWWRSFGWLNDCFIVVVCRLWLKNE